MPTTTAVLEEYNTGRIRISRQDAGVPELPRGACHLRAARDALRERRDHQLAHICMDVDVSCGSCHERWRHHYRLGPDATRKIISTPTPSRLMLVWQLARHASQWS